MSLALTIFNACNAVVPTGGFFSARRIWLRGSGVTLHEGVRIASGTRFYDRYISIGEHTWVGSEVSLFSHRTGWIQIGKNVDIGPRVMIVAGGHCIGTETRRAGKGEGKPIIVGDGAWVGAGAILLGGVEIGAGCIVAAGSIVLPGRYPSNVLIAGNPAEIKKSLG